MSVCLKYLPVFDILHLYLLHVSSWRDMKKEIIIKNTLFIYLSLNTSALSRHGESILYCVLSSLGLTLIFNHSTVGLNKESV